MLPLARDTDARKTRIGTQTKTFRKWITAMPKTTIRVVTRGADGSMRTRDYPNHEALLSMHTQVGIDDCSTDLELRGMPVFRGLIGPIPEGKQIVRYESPDVFEALTKEWTVARATRRTRRRIDPPQSLPPMNEPRSEPVPDLSHEDLS